MKNIKKYVIISLLFLASCSYKNHKVDVDLKGKNVSSQIGEDVSVSISVADVRKEKLVGKKIISYEKQVEIGINQDLERIIYQKVATNLSDRGFKIKNNNVDKIIAIHINNLSYESKKGILIGSSKIKVEVQVSIKDNRSKQIFTKKYGINSGRSHFVVSSKKADSKIINETLREVVNDILVDDGFLQNLIR